MNDEEKVKADEINDLDQVKRIFRLVERKGEELLAMMRLTFLCEISAAEKRQRWKQMLDQETEIQERTADFVYEEMIDEVIVYLHSRGFDEKRIAAIMDIDELTISRRIEEAKIEGKINE